LLHSKRTNALCYGAVVSRCALRDPRVGAYPQTHMLCTQHTTIKNFPCFANMCNTCPIFCLTQSQSVSTTPDSLLSFPNRSLPPNSLFQRGREPSAATGLSSAEDSGGKAHIKECNQQVPLTATAGVKCVCMCMCEHVSACVSEPC